MILLITYIILLAFYIWLVVNVRRQSNRQLKQMADILNNNKNITIAMLNLTIKFYVEQENYEDAQKCYDALERIKNS